MRGTIIFMTLAIILSAAAMAATLNCSIVPSGSCTETAVLYLQNSTGGYLNAQAQNASVNTYAYAICCDANAAGDTITTACTDNTFLLLSSLTNAHVQQTPIGTYPIAACISATTGNISCAYSNSCAATQSCLASMASSDGNNATNAHLGNCSWYQTKICCGMSSPPPAPILYYPDDDNNTLHDRTPLFIWYNSTDPDGEAVTYSIWVDDDKYFASPIIQGVGIDEGNMYGNATNYTNTTILNVDTKYFWVVQACDINSMCANSTRFNFTVESFAEITLLNAEVAFGSVSPRDINNTLNWAPAPIIAENTGNIDLDINITSTSLFTEKPNPDTYFQYMIQANETSSYLSAMSWQWFNFNQTVYNNTITKLNWSDTNDAFNLHVRIQVPVGEPPVARTANITVSAG